jgi:hypothetical protein
LRFSISAWPHETQPRFFAWPLTVEAGIGIGGRDLRVVGTPLTVEILLTIAPRTGRFARPVLRPKALGARPGFQQCAVDCEVLARQQALDFVLRQHRREKLNRHFALQQPIAVLGEARGIPHRILDTEPDKPAKQQVVVDPLDQLPLGADRIERLQQQRPHQPFRRDRLSADRRIQLVKLSNSPEAFSAPR